MKNKDFEKLEKDFSSTKSTYYDRNKSASLILDVFSYICNAVLVFFGYMFLHAMFELIPKYFIWQPTFIIFFVIVIQIGIEILKRILVYTTTKDYYRVIVINKEPYSKILAKAIFTVLLIGFSFYMSFDGSLRIGKPSEEHVIKSDSTIEHKKEILDSIANVKITNLQEKIDHIFYVAQEKDRIPNSREEQMINNWENKIKEIEQDIKTQKITIDTKYLNNQNKAKDNSSGNQWGWAVLCTFCEILYIIAMAFKANFRFHSFKEQNEARRKNPMFNKYQQQLELLKILFDNGSKGKEEKISGLNNFIALTRVKFPTILNSDIQTFISLCDSIGITKTGGDTGEGKRRYTEVNYMEAVKKIEEYYGFNN